MKRKYPNSTTDRLGRAMRLLAFLGMFLLGDRGSEAIAHGVYLDYRTERAIAITARFDSGQPMQNAQVTVYATDDPANPWLKGTTDENGQFFFIPDRAVGPAWDIQVRQAGHGEIVRVALDPDGEPAIAQQGQTGYTPLQMLLMGASGVWGFVGTALFFSRGK
ncbi:carboxypeptidase regulatory-like domain-containing protein [Oxynema sp. CENA135]|uniref:carboxypeptidase regulatory-like domain-containing protein n=1 Tax=Oxynema sp. CENA135 TaxID=984206 RepID=UPI00351BEFB5